MIIKDKILGECEVEIQIERSSVDSFIVSGSSVTLDRDLTDEEMNRLQEDHADVVQEYAYENGSRNHN